MKKILSLLFFILVLSSCSSNNNEINTHKTKVNESSLVSQENNIFGNINENRKIDFIKLEGIIKKDLDKIQIIWENDGKKDSYFLKKFKKGDKKWITNLKTEYGNLSVGKNKYTIVGYKDNKIIGKIDYIVNYNCIIKVYTNGDKEKFLENPKKILLLNFGDDKKCNNGILNLKFEKLKDWNPVQLLSPVTINLDNSKIILEQGGKIINGSFGQITKEIISGSGIIDSGENIKYSLVGVFKEGSFLDGEDIEKYITKENLDYFVINFSVGDFSMYIYPESKDFSEVKNILKEKIKGFKQINIINQ